MTKEKRGFDLMTSEEFEEILAQIVMDNADTLLSVPGVYEAVSEHFNNEVLDRWEADHPEAFDAEEDEEEEDEEEEDEEEDKPAE